MNRRIIKPTVQGNKVNYFLSFDMYPSDEDFDDIVVPDDPIIPDTPDDDDSDIIYDGGSLG